MKNTIKLFSIIALVALIGFSFASCVLEEEEKDGVLPAGNYTITGTPDQATSTGEMTAVSTTLNGTNPSFTVDADGVITALSLGSFLSWAPASGTQYRFTLSGGYLNFQIKSTGGNSFVNWSPRPAQINTVNYTQSITGIYLNTGIVQLTLRYDRADHNGTAMRTYQLKKQ
jgi:hypothetical protein